MMDLVRYLMLCLFAGMACMAHANHVGSASHDEPVNILDLDSGFRLDPVTGFIEDAGGDLVIADVEAMNWTYTGDGLSFGYTDSVYWFRLELENPSTISQHRLVGISYPVLDYIELYRRSGSEDSWDVISLGDKQRFQNRLISHRHFIVPLDLKAGETQEWIFRVDTSSSMQFPLNLWEERSFFVHDQNQLLGLGLYYGIMLIMVFYNLFVFFSVREANYLFYVLYVGCMAGFLGSLQGINFQYLWPEATQWNDQSIVVLLAGVVIFAGTFTRNFLSLPSSAPILNRLLTLLIASCVGIVFLSNLVPYHTLIRLLIVIAMVAMTCAIYLGIVNWSKGFTAARYYTVAWTSFLFGGIILALNKFNIIPRNFVTENSLQIGSALEVILLSFALADRLNQEKRERYEAQISALEHEKLARRAQTEALDQERNARLAQEKALEHERAAREAQAKALDIQKRATETLELRVKERTLELESVNRQLEKMSTTDALTNVRNRRFFDEHMAKEFALAVHDSSELAVLLLDIDHFKQINDRYGHQAGDEILRCVSGAIREEVGNDDLVARYGGEEFVVTLPGVSSESAMKIAEDIREAIAGLNFERISADLHVTISIGVNAGVPSPEDSQDQWVRDSDEALYASKENGRNQVTLHHPVA